MDRPLLPPLRRRSFRSRVGQEADPVGQDGEESDAQHGARGSRAHGSGATAEHMG
jgi:hypothetical protein